MTSRFFLLLPSAFLRGFPSCLKSLHNCPADYVLRVLFIHGIAGPTCPAGNCGHLDLEFEWRKLFVGDVQRESSPVRLQSHQAGITLSAVMRLPYYSSELRHDALTSEDFIQHEESKLIVDVPGLGWVGQK